MAANMFSLSLIKMPMRIRSDPSNTIADGRAGFIDHYKSH